MEKEEGEGLDGLLNSVTGSGMFATIIRAGFSQLYSSLQSGFITALRTMDLHLRTVSKIRGMR
jgi:hypothetical protein